jgi:hypothetical protein
VHDLATRADIAKLEHLIDKQSQTLTIRLGGLLVIVGALGALMKLLH